MYYIDQQIIIETSKGRLKTSIRGARSGAYLLISYSKNQPTLRASDKVVVKTIHYGSMYVLECEALGIFPEIDILAVSWPKNVSSSPFRQSVRHNFNLPVQVIVNSKSADATIKDMSIGGCRINAQIELDLGTEVSLSGILHGEISIKDIKAVVRNLGESVSEVEYGLEFIEPNATNKRALVSFQELIGRFDDVAFKAENDYEAPFDIGEKVNLQFDKNRMDCIIRGYKLDKYILTDTPKIKGSPVVADQGSKPVATFRFLKKGVAYGFEAPLIRQYTSPTSLWAWVCPEDFELVRLRRSERIQLLLGGSVALNNKEYSATVLDLSSGGASVAVEGEEVDVKRSDTAALSLTLPSGEKIDGVNCVVTAVRKGEFMTYLGLSFSAEENEASGWLKDFYNNQRAKLVS